MEEKKEYQTDASTGVKIVGGTEAASNAKEIKIVGGGKRPEEVTTLDKRPEPKQ